MSDHSSAKPASNPKVPLQVKVPPDLKREFKLYAVENDTDMSHLFAIVWYFYKQHHPQPPE